MSSKPVVFLGSSSEARRTAERIPGLLIADAYVIPWWIASEFGGLSTTFEALLEAPARYDFAIFLLTPDDVIESRDVKEHSTRDNVLFETGLFLGALGRERVEILVQRNADKEKKVKIPSDLMGVTIPGFEIDNRIALDATVSIALNNIRDRIRELGRYRRPWKLVEGWDFDPGTRTFSMTLGAVLLDRAAERLTGMAFFLIVRKEDANKDLRNDTDIFVSSLRPPTTGRELVISVSIPNTINIQAGDEIGGYLFGVSTDFKIANLDTIDAYIKAGAESIDGKALKVH